MVARPMFFIQRVLDIIIQTARNRMNELDYIKKEIETNQLLIDQHIEHNLQLQEKYDKLKLSNWQPDDGYFVIDSDGEIYSKKDWPTIDCYKNDVEFGSVRTTKTRAQNAAKNMKRFNRLSCFMGDTQPILEFSPISCALVFFDYDETKIETLKKILELKGEL